MFSGNHPFGNDDGDPTPSQDGWATDDSSDEYAFEYDGGGGGLWDESRGASLDQVIIKRAFDRRVLLDEVRERPFSSLSQPSLTDHFATLRRAC